MVAKINSQERKVIGRKFNKRTNFKNTNETCGANHGIVIFRNIIQYYRYGMDRTSWIKSSCWSWCRRHVYVVFTRVSFDVENGRTGTVAQCIGRGDKEEAHKYAQTAVQLATLMGLLFAAVMLLFLHPLVGFFQLQDPEALQAALSYTKIACGLIVFSFLTLTLTGIYTAQGDSKTPFIANFIGLVTNMILDPLLILGLGPVNKFGVNGAAIATVSAQAIVMTILILGIIRQKKQNVLKGIKLFTKIPFKYLSGICKIGIPTAIQGMVYCGISMVLTRMVSGFGAEAVAVQRVGGQIESVSWNTADGFGTALNAFIGQNYGAGKMDRVRKGYKASLCSVGIWGIFITIMFVFQPKAIAEIFFHEPKAIMIAIGYLTIIGVSEAFMAVELMTVGALSGLGKTHLCSVISILFTSARIPLAIILGGALLGLEGIWWAFSVTSIVKGIIFVCTFCWITRGKGTAKMTKLNKE